MYVEQIQTNRLSDTLHQGDSDTWFCDALLQFFDNQQQGCSGNQEETEQVDAGVICEPQQTVQSATVATV